MAATWQRALVWYDGSEPARRALGRVAGLARDGTAVEVVAVAPTLYPEPYGIVDPAEERRAQALLADARAALEREGVAPVTRLASGDPSQALLEAARECGADLLVVSVRERNLLQRLASHESLEAALGASCDVLIAR